MISNSTNLDRFLTSLHRRMVVVRIVERAGLCLLVSCLTSIALSPILIWRGESALGLISVCSAMGVILGLIWGIAQRPRMLDVAMEADRQLDLADLLGTVVATRSDESDLTTPGWRRTLLALADDRCRALAPSAVVLNRYGARTWSGIGLAAAMALTLALVSTRPELIRADDRPERISRVADERSPIEQNEPISPPGRSESRVSTDPQPDDLHNRSLDSTSEATDDSTKRTHLSLDRGSSSSDRDSSAAGAGTSEAEIHPRQKERVNDMGSPAQLGDGQTATGSGPASADSANGSDEADSGTVASRSSHHGRDPSASTDPFRGSDSAESSRTAGVPDAYRDLVRDYFSDDR